MKKFYLALFFLFLIQNGFSQNFNGACICINPGHGGHDSNDRFIAATGFWESDGNLAKGMALKNLLISMNAVVIMTRSTNTSADDLPLSQIVEIANANNVDYFHSIHSNGYNGMSNYTLILFQGRDNSPTYQGALEMGQYVGNEIYKAHRTTNKYIRGDFDFYGTGRPYLGVFKGLNMPGTLSEGSFHDYVPESWRLRNQAYDKHEAWAIAKAFISYFNLTPINTGLIAGIIRDPEQKVNYYSIPSTHDDIKPINNIKVTLQPGNKVYQGDNFNNGFYLFDSLAPGNYKIFYQAKDYTTDSSTVIVSANKTVFSDKYLLFDTTIAPVVLSHLPSSSVDSVSPNSKIKITFNRIMNKEVTESSFSISPDVNGTFSWENGDKTLVFTPILPYEKSTKYIVNISDKAASKWNIALDSSYSFSFITGNRNRLALVDSYPKINEKKISSTVQFRLTFDAPISMSSLSGQVMLYNSSNEFIAVKNVKVFSKDDKGYIYFEPKDNLLNDSTYKIILRGGITDINNIPLLDSIQIPFTVEPPVQYSGFVLNNFENLDGWWYEGFNGADSNSVIFNSSTLYKISDKYSAKFSYNFQQNSKESIRLVTKIKKNISGESNLQFGMWIFGDKSNNILKYYFSNDSTNGVPIFADTLDWTGWKFKHAKINNSSFIGEQLFYGLVLEHNPAGTNTSSIYLDDATYTSSATLVSENINEPESFKLSQNYPNPFNPSTTIDFSLPKSGFVSLKIFNPLGEEVKTLINSYKKKGNYSIKYDAGKLSSGIYLYRLSVEGFNSTKKMILLK